MKNLTYLGPGALLRVAGREIPRGSTDEVPDRDADALLANPLYDVTVTDVPKKDGETKPDAETGDRQPEADAGEGQPNDSESENEEEA